MPPLYPAPFSSPAIPAPQGARGAPDHCRTSATQVATGPLWGLGGAGMPPGWESPHKRPHRGKQRGDRRGGPLGPPAACLHRHFRPIILDNFFSMATRFLIRCVLLRHLKPDHDVRPAAAPFSHFSVRRVCISMRVMAASPQPDHGPVLSGAWYAPPPALSAGRRLSSKVLTGSAHPAGARTARPCQPA